jgi:hypothetical protein
VTGSVTEAQLETGSVATRYQWVNTVADYDTVGFNKYLKFDGVDDNMAIVNVSIAQPFQVFLGINNYFSGTGSGDANLLRSNTLAVGYRAGGGKNFSIYAGLAVTSTAAYIEARVVRTDIFNGGASAIRSNRVSYPGNAGTLALAVGNPLYIGSSGTSTSYAGVDIYSLIIRGALSSDAQIINAETYVNSKTGAY